MLPGYAQDDTSHSQNYVGPRMTDDVSGQGVYLHGIPR